LLMRSSPPAVVWLQTATALVADRVCRSLFILSIIVCLALTVVPPAEDLLLRVSDNRSLLSARPAHRWRRCPVLVSTGVTC
jgi:hypothetical protein